MKNKKQAGQVTLESGQFGWDYLLKNDDGRDILVQTDFDYPAVASNLGWVPCHDCTDGTIACKECGKSATDLISEAQAFLDEHVGESFEDPGYFSDEADEFAEKNSKKEPKKEPIMEKEESVKATKKFAARFKNLFSSKYEKWIPMQAQLLASNNYGDWKSVEEATEKITKATQEISDTITKGVFDEVKRIVDEKRQDILDEMTEGLVTLPNMPQFPAAPEGAPEVGGEAVEGPEGEPALVAPKAPPKAGPKAPGKAPVTPPGASKKAQTFEQDKPEYQKQSIEQKADKLRHGEAVEVSDEEMSQLEKIEDIYKSLASVPNPKAYGLKSPKWLAFLRLPEFESTWKPLLHLGIGARKKAQLEDLEIGEPELENKDIFVEQENGKFIVGVGEKTRFRTKDQSRAYDYIMDIWGIDEDDPAWETIEGGIRVINPEKAGVGPVEIAEPKVEAPKVTEKLDDVDLSIAEEVENEASVKASKVAKLALEDISRSATEIDTDDFTILFSYSTPVAYLDKKSDKYFKIDKKFSSTTSKHINKWLAGKDSEEISEEKMDKLVITLGGSESKTEPKVEEPKEEKPEEKVEELTKEETREINEHEGSSKKQAQVQRKASGWFQDQNGTVIGIIEPNGQVFCPGCEGMGNIQAQGDKLDRIYKGKAGFGMTCSMCNQPLDPSAVRGACDTESKKAQLSDIPANEPHGDEDLNALKEDFKEKGKERFADIEVEQEVDAALDSKTEFESIEDVIDAATSNVLDGLEFTYGQFADNILESITEEVKLLGIKDPEELDEVEMQVVDAFWAGAALAIEEQVKKSISALRSE